MDSVVRKVEKETGLAIVVTGHAAIFPDHSRAAGDPLDNALMESTIGLYKTELRNDPDCPR